VAPSPDALAAGKLPDPGEGEAEAARLNAEALGHIAEADRSGLGPAEVALLEAADRTIDWYGGVDAALMAQVRGKLTDPGGAPAAS